MIRHLVAPAVAGLILVVAGADTAITGTCVPRWHQVPTPKIGQSGFQDVAAISASDAWAVGARRTAKRERPLIEHWNGQGWAVSPVAIGREGALFGVSATTTDDVWAVGSSTGVGRGDTLVEHWDGRRWQRVAVPSPGDSALLYDVKAISATDVWVAGSKFRAHPWRWSALIEHFDGTRWTAVAAPTHGLLGVDAAGSGEAWAAGDGTIHWNGHRWSRVAGPSTTLSDVAVVASNDVWAVGTGLNASLIEHWNGRRWSRVRHVTLRGQGVPVGLWALEATSSSDVWAVGSNVSKGGVVEHWNGRRWSVSHRERDELFGVSAATATDVWAVGGIFSPRIAHLTCG